MFSYVQPSPALLNVTQTLIVSSPEVMRHGWPSSRPGQGQVGRSEIPVPSQHDDIRVMIREPTR